MPELKCPDCGRVFEIGEETVSPFLTCPHCDAEVPIEDLPEELAAPSLRPGPRPGDTFGGYTIRDFVAFTGSASLFVAAQRASGRTVTLKVLTAESLRDDEAVARFRREAETLASIRHDNVVRVLDFGDEDGLPFLAMPDIEGESLRAVLGRERRLPQGRALNVASQVLAGLACAHGRGVVHRNLKPDSVLIGADGVARVSDFGLAHVASPSGETRITRVGQSLGDLTYAAPEQLADASSVDRRADLYSVGVLLYQMLTGSLPVGHYGTPTELRPELDVRLDDVTLRALRMDPAGRCGSAEDMAWELDMIAGSPTITAADRQEREAAAPETETYTRVYRCPECSHENAPDQRTCERCGADLSALLESCPVCGAPCRADSEICAGCGRDIQKARAKESARIKDVWARVQELCRLRQYDSALAELETVAELPGARNAAVRSKAASLSEKVRRKRERLRARIYEAGQRMLLEGTPDEALRIWRELPEDYRDARERIEELKGRIREAKEGLPEARARWKRGDVMGALGHLERALRVWPRDVKLQRQVFAARQRLASQGVVELMLFDAARAEDDGETQKAQVLYEQVRELDPDNRKARDGLDRIEVMFVDEGEQEGRKIHRRRPPRPINLRLPLAPLIVVVAVALAFVIGYLLRSTSGSGASEINRRMEDALDLGNQGAWGRAIKRYEGVIAEFPENPRAEDARKEAAQLREALYSGRRSLKKIRGRFEAGEVKEALADLTAFRESEAGGAEDLQLPAKRLAVDIRDWGRGVARGRGKDVRPLADYVLAHQALTRSAEEADEAEARRLQEAIEAFRTRMDAARQAESRSASAAMANCVEALKALPLVKEGVDYLASIASRAPAPPGMVLVPRGVYTVGGGPGNPKREFVSDCGYYIDNHEVTIREYVAFLNATGHPAPTAWRQASKDANSWRRVAEVAAQWHGELPMRDVTYADAEAYAKWAGKDLPTEEEWEAAARGAKALPYPGAKAWSADLGNFAYASCRAGDAPRDRSPCGAWNMAGNLAEWTRTRVLAPPKPKPEATPRTPSAGAATGGKKGGPLAGRPDDGFELARKYAGLQQNMLGRLKDVATGKAGISDLKRDQRKQEAEWSGKGAPARRDEPRPSTEKPAEPPPPPKPTFLPNVRVIKGCSWLGTQRDRWSACVPAGLPDLPPAVGQAGRAGTTDARPGTLLAAFHGDGKDPAATVRRSGLRDWRLFFTGVATGASAARAHIQAFRWVPELGAWVGASLMLKPGDPIEGEHGELHAQVAAAGEGKQPKTVRVPFRSGCRLLDFSKEDGLARVRDACGVIRRLRLTTPRQVPRSYTRSPRASGSAAAGPSLPLPQAAAAWSRIRGKTTDAYVNVGFRCVKHIVPPAEAEGDKEEATP